MRNKMIKMMGNNIKKQTKGQKPITITKHHPNPIKTKRTKQTKQQRIATQSNSNASTNTYQNKSTNNFTHC